MVQQCPCCGHAVETAKPLVRFADVPISGVFLDKPNSTLPRANLELTFCPGCGLASKVATPGNDFDYTTIDRGTAQQMPDYAAHILEWMAEAGVAGSTRLVEVGSNDGSFLDHLSANGFTSLRGIEPSLALARTAMAKGYAIETGYCTPHSAAALTAREGAFAAVVCRHTLEHVPSPADLLAAIGKLLSPGGIALIEVPDFDWVLETLAVHEIWDEHVSYFARANLSLALARTGFDVLRCERIRFRDTRNLVAVARWRGVGTATKPSGPADTAATIAGCEGLGRRWQVLTERLQRDAPAWPRPVLAIGASHIQSNFIHFAGLSEHVDGLIDDDPRKAGKFVMLDAPRPVTSTAAAISAPGAGTVLRTAFPYPGWMDKVCAAMSERSARIVDPYAGLPHPVAKPD